MKKHKWTVEKDKTALYAYRFCTSEEIIHIAEKLPMSNDSFKMRIENFRYLDRGKGLNHCSKQSKKIFKKYKDLSKKEFGLRDIMKMQFERKK